jgi:hypothetical protein
MIWRRADHGVARVAVSLALSLLTACSSNVCEVGARSCREWVVVVRSRPEATVAANWLQARGWPVGQVVPDLHLVHVWLPSGSAGEDAVKQIRAQAWARYVTDQATPRIERRLPVRCEPKASS